ncbi:MAG: nucleotidyltransferase domain-containing protein [Campylobacterales bacterium]|nr:nucleotidyltransferase domain-containing protein [Campylobacterales bacterium]
MTERSFYVNFGYIFGPYATGLQTSKSDLDVALYLKDDSFDKIPAPNRQYINFFLNI